jgi:putative transposase
LYEGTLETPETRNTNRVIGLDMSMENMYVDSDGNTPGYNRLYRNNHKRLAKLQRIHSTKTKGSNNRRKANHNLNKKHRKIVNQRQDFIHKLSRKLVHENDTVVIEDLNMRAMSQCLNLGKSVHDLGWGEFVRQLEYKGEQYGCKVMKADRWFASSKTCSHCGNLNKELRLSDRE